MRQLKYHLAISLMLLWCGSQQPVLGDPPEDAAAKAPGRSTVNEVDWVRAGVNTDALAWGIRGRLMWGLPPATGQPADGPRGLIRLRYPVLPHGVYDLINFIAIEPVVGGHKGFSELERSQLDDRPGKRLWVAEPGPDAPQSLAGQLTKLESGAEQLTLEIKVERFDNGAHVRLTVTQRSDNPDELQLSICAEDTSGPIDYCVLTATMGNKARARQLWLRDRTVSSLDLYADYRESGFAPHRFFGLNELHRTAHDDVLVAITTDESDPASVEPFPRRVHWYYGGLPVTQYWKKPAGTWRDDLHVAVNARYTYWLSHRPIPGGMSFENFELRERFYDHQRFVFGMTTQAPRDVFAREP